MLKPIVWIFLFIAGAFASVHMFAMYASLYWYYPWFDILMHFWGGLLIGLGLHALGTFSRINRRPNTLVVFFVAFLFVVVWEIFEWYSGVFDSVANYLDTIHDMFNGIIGALLAHQIIKKIKK